MRAAAESGVFTGDARGGLRTRTAGATMTSMTTSLTVRLALCLLLGLGACRKAEEAPALPRVPQPAGPPRLGAGTPPAEPLPPALVLDALTQGWTCLPLDGAPRVGLSVDGNGGDGAREVRWLERRLDLQGWDLYAADLTTRAVRLVRKDVGPEARLAPGQATTLAWLQEARPQGLDGPLLRSLLAADGPEAQGRQVSHQTHDVTSFLLDGQDAVYTAHGMAWRVPLAGGPPRRIGQAEHVWAVVEGSADLVVREAGRTQRLDAAGTLHPLGPDAQKVVVYGKDVVLAGDGAPRLGSLAPGVDPAVPLAGFRPEDKLLTSSDAAWLTRPEPPTKPPGPNAVQLMAVTAGELVPIVTLGPAWPGEAVRLPAGALAVLLVHDTDQDAQRDARTGDEADVCVLAPALKPLVIPERVLPMRLAAAMPQVRALLAAEGVAALQLKVAAGPRLQVRAQGQPPESPEAMLAQLRRVQAGLTRLSGDPRLGVVLRWETTDALSAATWAPELEGFLHQARLGDVVFGDRRDFRIEAAMAVRWRDEGEVEGSGVVVPVGITAATSDTEPAAPIRAEPVDLAVFCTPTSEVVEANGRHRAPLPAWGANKEAWFTVICRNPPDAPPPKLRIESGGRNWPWFDAAADRDAADWLKAVGRIVRDTGFTPRLPPMPDDLLPDLERPMDPGRIRHETEHFDAPVGFAALQPKQREKLARALWIEVALHLEGQHGRKPELLHLHAPGGQSWALDRTSLREIEKPAAGLPDPGTRQAP